MKRLILLLLMATCQYVASDTTLQSSTSTLPSTRTREMSSRSICDGDAGGCAMAY